ncbi:MAG: 50S ribosomal protein L4 [Micavibrio aeruginosavorus]|uniref:Large ribosomal subunit protein uL4 n=1 Tax=Micavibrio aeruginosavorus TaxID=349221 RepID=A0A2W5FDL6_9BACT|nr:MAG: 50S ribosomal protein L4 [Micavibrio aeruginosavorus]
MKIAVKNLQNKDAGSIELNDEVFAVEIRQDILHRMVRYQLNKRQAGTHKTKDISEVSGTGKKPFKQKGTGSARRGTNRAPHHRGGARMFGPVVRSHATEMPKRERALALKIALSSKVASGKLIILDSVTTAKPNTKEMVGALKTMGVTSAVFVTGPELDVNFALSARNIPLIDVLSSDGANVYDILRRDTLVLTKDAVDALTTRLTADKAAAKAAA